MSNTYSWEIIQLECHADFEGKSNVVFLIGWARSATNGIISASIGGATEISINISSSFTDFNALTQAQVIDWLVTALGEEKIMEIDSNLDKQIEERANPPIVSPPLPWGV